MRFTEDDGWAIASHVALSGLTSLFPFLIFVTALSGFFGTKTLADEAARLIFDSWPAQVAGPIATEIHNVLTQTRSGVLTIGAVLALYFSSSAVEALRVALNRAYEVRDPRPWYLLRLESIAYVLLGAFSLISFATLVVFAPFVWDIVVKTAPALEALAYLFTFGRIAVATIILLAALTVAHKFLAAGRRTFGQIAPGIVLTFALWIGFGEGFGLYLARFARNYVTTYAGLASVMIAVVFLYMLSAIFIFGGELNAAQARARQSKTIIEMGDSDQRAAADAEKANADAA